MWLSRWNAMLASLFLAAVLAIPAAGTNSAPYSVSPGTLNYVEGQASLGNGNLNAKSVGSVSLQPGETLLTQKGKAELLLTPGVFFRLGDNSSASMVSNSLTDTSLVLNRGEALVEVDQIYPQNNIRICQDAAITRLQKTGLYDFEASGQVRVFDGQALVQYADHSVKVKGGHELTLNVDGKLKPNRFDKNAVQQSDDLYRWSSLRSDYLAEANVAAARVYVSNRGYGPGWFGAGWYRSPWFGAYTFVPADGYLFSPFGWPYWSPLWVYRAPYRSGYFVHSPARFGRVPFYSREFHSQPSRSVSPRTGVRQEESFVHVPGGFQGRGWGGFHSGGNHGFGRR
ncbi:MAG: FecR domain-containing protein [Terriglobales bacterium]